MDKLTSYRTLIRRLLSELAALVNRQPTPGVETLCVFDQERDQYLLLPCTHLDEINDALDRIEQGTFGRCEVCGQEIPRERLKAVPYARYCLRHAQELQARARK